jgi:hypothetical protein
MKSMAHLQKGPMRMIGCNRARRISCLRGIKLIVSAMLNYLDTIGKKSRQKITCVDNILGSSHPKKVATTRISMGSI